MRNEYLEIISDRIRRGEPVGVIDALAAIDYQHALQKERKENSVWQRLLRLRSHLLKVKND
jgi:hypothetical protein